MTSVQLYMWCMGYNNHPNNTLSVDDPLIPLLRKVPHITAVTGLFIQLPEKILETLFTRRCRTWLCAPSCFPHPFPPFDVVLLPKHWATTLNGGGRYLGHCPGDWGNTDYTRLFYEQECLNNFEANFTSSSTFSFQFTKFVTSVLADCTRSFNANSVDFRGFNKIWSRQLVWIQ